MRYERDSFDQLIAVHDGKADPWTATYDGLDRRISSGRGDRQTLFWWDDDRLAAETFPDGTFRIYVYAHERALVPIGFVDYDDVDAAPESGRAYSVYADQVGLPLCIADSEGQVVWWAEHVDPYGAIHIRPGALVEYNLRWPGHYFDPDTGLHYNRFRYYDPRLGRYLESDPLGCAGGVNLYAYAKNPLVSVDVLGLHNEESDPPDEKGKNKPAQEETDEAAPKPKAETLEEMRARLDEKIKKRNEETRAREREAQEADRKVQEERAERQRRNNAIDKQAEAQSLEDAKSDPQRDTSRDPVDGEDALRNHMGRDGMAPEYGYYREDGTFVMVEVKNGKHPDAGLGSSGALKQCAGSLVHPFTSSGPSVVVMEPSEHRKRYDSSTRTGASRGGRSRNALREPLVGSARIEIRGILGQHTSQMAFPEDDDVVEALAAHTAEEAFAGSVHERCANRGFLDANARALSDTVEVRAELGIAIADDEVRPRPEQRQLAELLRGPALARFASDGDMNDLLGVDVDHEEGEQRTKPDIVDLEKVARPDRMVPQERAPAVAVSPRTDSVDVTLDGTFC